MINIGILGAGRIAVTMAKTVRGMNEAGNDSVHLLSVGARDKERAEQFAKDNGVEKAFGSYEELLSDPELDLVYIAVPHSHHAESVKLCLEHGKHVLCEKAFTANVRQAEEIIRMAEDKKLLLTEAIWTRYQPMRKMINDVVASGVVGQPRTLTANLDYSILGKERMTDPALAGGALLDVGVYALNFAEMVFGHPDRVQGIATLTDRGVDETDSVTLTWKDGRMAILNSGMSAISDRFGVIYCTEGFIMVENINNPQVIRVYDKNYKMIDKIRCPQQITGYEYEVMEAVDCIEKGLIECPSMPHSETLHVMEMMDALRMQMGVKYPFEV